MKDKKRRQLVKMIGTSVTIPLSAVVSSLPGRADERPLVDEFSAGARNWDYMSVSDKAAKNCGNCALYQGEFDSKVGPCPLFPYMHVSIDAWCNAHSPTPG